MGNFIAMGGQVVVLNGLHIAADVPNGRNILLRRVARGLGFDWNSEGKAILKACV